MLPASAEDSLSDFNAFPGHLWSLLEHIRTVIPPVGAFHVNILFASSDEPFASWLKGQLALSGITAHLNESNKLLVTDFSRLEEEAESDLEAPVQIPLLSRDFLLDETCFQGIREGHRYGSMVLPVLLDLKGFQSVFREKACLLESDPSLQAPTLALAPTLAPTLALIDSELSFKGEASFFMLCFKPGQSGPWEQQF